MRHQFTVGDLSLCVASSVDNNINDYNGANIYVQYIYTVGPKSI